MLCRHCENWELDAQARFCGNCGNCTLPLTVQFSPKAVQRGDPELDRTGVTAQLSSTGNFDLDGLALVMRREDTGDAIETIPISHYRLNRKSTDKASGEPVPLEEVGYLAQGNEAVTLLPVIVWEGGAGARDLVPLCAHLDVNAVPAVHGKVEERITWRGELGHMEVAVSVEGSGVLFVDTAELVLRSGASTASARAGEDVHLTVKMEPGMASAQRPLLLRFAVDDVNLQKIKQKGTPLEAELVLSRGAAAPPQRLPFQVASGGKPVPKLLVPSAPVNAMLGRRTRMGFAVQNDGGSAFRVAGWRWKMSDRRGAPIAEGGEEALHFIPPAPFACPPGARFAGEIAIELPSTALGYHVVVLEAVLADQESTISKSIDLNIVPPNNLAKSVVCVDFGTTESAASIIRDTGLEAMPDQVALGRVGFIADDDTVVEDELFLPTAAAALCRSGGGAGKEKIEWTFGAEALQLVSAIGAVHGVLALFKNLKWRLGAEHEQVLPNGDQIPVQDIVSLYLSYLIDRFETHPSICGDLQSIYITKPAIYRDSQAGALVRAFKNARGQDRRSGPNVEYYKLGDKRFLISESWPPVYAVIPGVQKRLKGVVFPGLGDATPENLDERFGRGANVVTFDVGGGSLDVSLLYTKSEPQPGRKANRLRISELYNTTSKAFCGEAFSKLIDLEIEALLVERLGGVAGARSFRELGIEVQRDDGRVTPENAANARALGRVREFFQQDSGAFLPLFDRGLGEMEAPDGALQHDGAVVAAISKWLGSSGVDPRNAAPRIVLQAAGGTRNYRFDGDEVVHLIARITSRFYETHRKAIDGVFKSLADKQVDSSAETVVLITGRGSLFPLASHLAEAAAKRFFGALFTLRRAEGPAAKWITSMGGALVARDNKKIVNINFCASVEGRYSAIASLSIFGDEGPEFVDFSPDGFGAEHPVGVLRLDRVGELLLQDEPLEIVRRFNDSADYEAVTTVTASALGSFDVGEDWLAIRLQPSGTIESFVAKGQNEEAAIANASSRPPPESVS